MTLEVKDIIYAVVAFVSAFNAYNNQKIKNSILEVQLNLRKEFNGRYETLENAQAQERRVERLEEKVFK